MEGLEALKGLVLGPLKMPGDSLMLEPLRQSLIGARSKIDPSAREAS